MFSLHRARKQAALQATPVDVERAHKKASWRMRALYGADTEELAARAERRRSAWVHYGPEDVKAAVTRRGGYSKPHEFREVHKEGFKTATGFLSATGSLPVRVPVADREEYKDPAMDAFRSREKRKEGPPMRFSFKSSGAPLGHDAPRPRRRKSASTSKRSSLASSRPSSAAATRKNAARSPSTAGLVARPRSAAATRQPSPSVVGRPAFSVHSQPRDARFVSVSGAKLPPPMGSSAGPWAPMPLTFRNDDAAKEVGPPFLTCVPSGARLPPPGAAGTSSQPQLGASVTSKFTRGVSFASFNSATQARPRVYSASLREIRASP